jgi:hypothetical protein
MKKFLSVLVMALFSFNVAASAAEIEITKAEKDDSGYVSVECNISDTADSQIITTVAREYTAEDDDVDSFIYIDQFTPDITDGSFDYNFNVSANFDETKVYLVRVGGTGVYDIAQKIIAVSGKTVYVAGDVNGDGYIDEIDAALVLKYINGTYALDEAQLKAADANETQDVNMLDVVEILSVEE